MEPSIALDKTGKTMVFGEGVASINGALGTGFASIVQYDAKRKTLVEKQRLTGPAAGGSFGEHVALDPTGKVLAITEQRATVGGVVQAGQVRVCFWFVHGPAHLYKVYVPYQSPYTDRPCACLSHPTQSLAPQVHIITKGGLNKQWVLSGTVTPGTFAQAQLEFGSFVAISKGTCAVHHMFRLRRRGSRRIDWSTRYNTNHKQAARFSPWARPAARARARSTSSASPPRKRPRGAPRANSAATRS